jgi:Protein of unknown function (DUF3179)
VLRREIDGLRLTFHLAGINNQNFLMRDEETGTYWQQISGAAIAGPLAGRRLAFVSSDELTFALWKAEQPQGSVLNDVGAYTRYYARKDWDVRMKKAPTVLSYAEPGLAPRDLMLGIRAFGASRAFPYAVVLSQKLVQDHVGSEPVMLVTGPDGQSVRAFRQKIAGIDHSPDFYRVFDENSKAPLSVTVRAALLMDSVTGSQWNFQGCAVSGGLQGRCLERVEMIKDYWFDWRHYNPDTTVFGHKRTAADPRPLRFSKPELPANP